MTATKAATGVNVPGATLRPDGVAAQRYSRLRVPSDEELPQGVLDMIAKTGEQADRAIALNPESLLRLFAYLGPLLDPSSGELSAAERDLIASVVAAENRCTIALTYHARKLGDHIGDHQRALGIAVNPRQGVLSERERAIALLALELTRESGAVDDQDLDRLREVGMSDDAIFQVIELVAIFNATTIIENALGLHPSVTLWT